jgi:hypothetical protein
MRHDSEERKQPLGRGSCTLENVGRSGRDASNALFELDDPAGLEASEGLEPAVAQRSVPTIVPQFDPQEYAAQSEVREHAPTLIDEDALEHARLMSLPSRVPPPRAPASTLPGPLGVSTRDSSAEVDLGEEDISVLCTDEQIALLRDRLGPLGRVPTLARRLTELGKVLEDPKTAFVLGFVDGILPIETILDVTGLPELDTLKILDRMVSQSIVLFRPSRKPTA